MNFVLQIEDIGMLHRFDNFSIFNKTAGRRRHFLRSGGHLIKNSRLPLQGQDCCFLWNRAITIQIMLPSSHPLAKPPHISDKINMRDDGCQHIGYGFCHVDSPDSYEVGEDEGQGEQEQEFAHDPEDKGVPGVAKGYECVLVHHLQSQDKDRAEHDAHGDGGKADEFCIAGKHAADLGREGNQAEPHKCGAANA